MEELTKIELIELLYQRIEEEHQQLLNHTSIDPNKLSMNEIIWKEYKLGKIDGYLSVIKLLQCNME